VTTVLDVRLRELGWEHGQFSREFTQTGQRLGYRGISVGARTLERWRAGEQKPQPRAREVLAAMFELPVDQLLAQAPEPEPDGPHGDVYRRQVLRTALAAAGLGVAAPALAALEQARRTMDDVLQTSHVGAATLERWERAADEYAAAYQITPAGVLLGDVVADFVEVQGLLAQSTPVRVRIGLSRAAHRLALLAAVLLSSMGEHREARAWLHTSRLAAEESGDTVLVGQALARSAIVSLYYGSPAAALVDAQRAIDVLGETVCPAAARAWVVKARAHARLAHVDQALEALVHGERLHSGLSAEEKANTAFGYTARQFTWHCANALVHLDRGDEAAALQREALAAYAPSERLDPTLIRLDAAVTMLRAGDPAAAAESATAVWTALPAAHRTGMVQRYIGDLLVMVPQPAAALPAVTGLRELTAGRAS
jgi:tetratricopeptide (TPR) repeat protein